MRKSIKSLSKGDVTTSVEEPGIEMYKLSCLMRIAAASEAMSNNYVRLQDDVERYKRWYNEEKAAKEKMQRQVTALKGVITKMKNLNIKNQQDL